MLFSNWMWDRIPEMTRERDYEEAAPDAPLDETGRGKGPLRQLVDVLASGFDAIKADVDSFHDLIDIDACPEQFLPHLAYLFGFEFPFDLSEQQQRNYLHTIISMYRTKGTAWTLRLAALRIIGKGFDLIVENEDYIGKTFDVVVEADEENTVQPQLEQKLRYMVDQYSPAGMIPNVKLVYYFTEVSALATRINDNTSTSTVFAAWRMNFPGHKINLNIRTNDFGETALSY
jgi:phage tail-like protein